MGKRVIHDGNYKIQLSDIMQLKGSL